jgi:hypothetical protein
LPEDFLFVVDVLSRSSSYEADRVILEGEQLQILRQFLLVDLLDAIIIEIQPQQLLEDCDVLQPGDVVVVEGEVLQVDEVVESLNLGDAVLELTREVHAAGRGH